MADVAIDQMAWDVRRQLPVTPHQFGKRRAVHSGYDAAALGAIIRVADVRVRKDPKVGNPQHDRVRLAAGAAAIVLGARLERALTPRTAEVEHQASRELAGPLPRRDR